MTVKRIMSDCLSKFFLVSNKNNKAAHKKNSTECDIKNLVTTKCTKVPRNPINTKFLSSNNPFNWISL